MCQGGKASRGTKGRRINGRGRDPKIQLSYYIGRAAVACTGTQVSVNPGPGKRWEPTLPYDRLIE